MGTAKQFRAQLEGFTKKVERVLTVLPQLVASDLRYRTAFATPILTGRASGSWNASAVNIDRSVKPESYLNPDGAPTDGNDTVNRGKLGDVYHVSNVIHYIGNLNAGSSTKAPAGFVEMAAVESQVLMPRFIAQAKAEAGL